MTVLSKIRFNHKVANKTWFGTGGNAKIFFSPDNERELSLFLKFLPKRIPIFCLGLGSNILIRDGGFNGAIIKLGNGFKYIHQKKNKKILTLGCATKDLDCANYCLINSITGFEFLIGIPGTIGGALRMNASCYEQSISDKLVEVKIMDRYGKIFTLSKKQLNFNYRQVSIPQNHIFLEASFKINKIEQDTIKNRMKRIKLRREISQPIKNRTGGSTFKNTVDKMAWKLIDEVGFRGIKVGSAKISEKHANFIINVLPGNSLNIEILGEKIVKKVFEKKGIKLEWEIERVGNFVKI